MDDIADTIQAKSDQLNAADLMGGPVVLKILAVTVNKSSDQPISVKVDQGYQPYKPCKSMRRLMAVIWGLNSKDWIGHSIKVYCDLEVTWGGKAVGGIRILSATGIDEKRDFPLRSSKVKVVTYTVEPLKVQERQTEVNPLVKAQNLEDLKEIFSKLSSLDKTKWGSEKDRLKNLFTNSEKENLDELPEQEWGSNE